jgi:hypothetical protein
MDKNILGMPPLKREGQAISENCLEGCQIIAMWAKIERLQKANHRLAEIATDAVGWLPPASVNGPREKYQNEIRELTDGHC